MKRLLTLMVICCFLVATAGISFASELSSYGYFRTTVQYQSNQDFDDDSRDQNFAAEQRVRQYFEYKQNENLKAVIGFEFDSIWGDTMRLANDSNAFELRQAYLDFDLPNNSKTNLKIGGQWFALPGINWSSPVLGGQAPGIKINNSINDKIDMNLGWVRMIEDQNATNNGAADMFYLTAPIDKNQFSMTPWVSYARVEKEGMDQSPSYGGAFDVVNSYNRGMQTFDVTSLGTLSSQFEDSGNYTDGVNAYWIGFLTNIKSVSQMDIQLEGAYGSVEADQDQNDRSGYWIRGLFDYTEMENMTPSLFGFYSSGEDDDLSDGSETMPYFGNDGVTITQTGYLTGFGSMTNLATYNYALMQYVPHAMWQLGLGLKNIKATKKLSFNVAASYMRGTNDKDAFDGLTQDQRDTLLGSELTTEDAAWEIDVNGNYSIYENLDAMLELGYGQVNLDESVWGDNPKEDPAFKCVTGIKYSY